MQISTAAKIIAKARLDGGKLNDYPCRAPAGTDEAIALQDAVMAEFGGEIAGWKIGCTNPAAQKALNTDQPFFGPVPTSRLFQTGAEIKIAPNTLGVVEAEVALKLNRDLPPKPGDYTLSQVCDAVDCAFPALELVDRRLPGGLADGVNWNIADGGLNDALVLGGGTFDLPLEMLPSLEITALINDKIVSTGVGENALGGAQFALQWIANTFSNLGRTLRAGDVITTGLTTDIVTVNPGDLFEAKFSELGSVRAKFV